MLLCEYVLNSTRAPPSEALLFHTLLQLYLADDLPEEQDEQSMAATSETTRRYVLQFSAGSSSKGGVAQMLLHADPLFHFRLCAMKWGEKDIVLRAKPWTSVPCFRCTLDFTSRHVVCKFTM